MSLSSSNGFFGSIIALQTSLPQEAYESAIERWAEFLSDREERTQWQAICLFLSIAQITSALDLLCRRRRYDLVSQFVTVCAQMQVPLTGFFFFESIRLFLLSLCRNNLSFSFDADTAKRITKLAIQDYRARLLEARETAADAVDACIQHVQQAAVSLLEGVGLFLSRSLVSVFLYHPLILMKRHFIRYTSEDIGNVVSADAVHSAIFRFSLVFLIYLHLYLVCNSVANAAAAAAA